MRELEVVLIVSWLDMAKRGSGRCLLFPEEGGFALPVRAVSEQESVVDAAASLLRDTTGLKARIGKSGWVVMDQMPLVETFWEVRQRTHYESGRVWEEPTEVVRSKIAVPYGVVIPGELTTMPDGAEWVSYADVLSSKFVSDHKDILTAVLARM